MSNEREKPDLAHSASVNNNQLLFMCHSGFSQQSQTNAQCPHKDKNSSVSKTSVKTRFRKMFVHTGAHSNTEITVISIPDPLLAL